VTALPRIQWRVPAYLPYVQPALTDAAIEDAERQLRFRLPDAYVAALREQNGGYLRYGTPGISNEMLWGIGPRWPSIMKGSLAVDEGGWGWLPDGAAALIPFDGDGHWYLCFDARDRPEAPAVTYVDVECRYTRLVAATFIEYVASMDPGDRTVIGVATTLDLAEAARRLATALRAKAVDQGDDAHGYPTYFVRAKKKGREVLSWVSPNQVARGFVRPSHREYVALVGSLPGTALRWPEHPDCTVIVQTTCLDVGELLDACERAGLPARLL